MAKRSTEHVVSRDHGELYCLYCRSSYTPTYPIDITTWGGLVRGFVKAHARCPRPKGPFCTVCGATDHLLADHVTATCPRPENWPTCGDTGTSSEAIWAHFMGRTARRWDPPSDGQDLGRCLRLLAAPWAKGWRERIGEMAARPGWGPLVGAWAELEELYAAALAPGGDDGAALYRRMKELRGEEI